jgi:salicylate hydroxylase
MTRSASNPPELKVIIVGAGLSGLTAAVRLAQLGHKVHVLEREPAISPRGGGIVFVPNVIRVFESWGLTGAFTPIVDVLERTVLRRHGDEKVLRRIYREGVKGYAGYVRCVG